MRHSRSLPLLLSLSLAALTGCEGRVFGSVEGWTLIRGAQVADGTGGPITTMDVRVAEGRIREIVDPGSLRPRRGEVVVDAEGMVLAPGFIDTHSHHDGGLESDPTALEAVSQGITTIVAGADGGSVLPLGELFTRLRQQPVAVNVASYSGHNSIRAAVLGEDYAREATEEEVGAMTEFVGADMRAGALGLSTGLEYDPGIYSTTEEVITLAREAARFGGRYSSHMRSEDRAFWEALDETLRIGAEAQIPVHISHMKLAMQSLWGRSEEALAKLDSARAEGISVSADVYPYNYWQSTMTVLLPERDFEDRSAFRFALDELVPPSGFRIARFDPDPEYVGLTLDSIARIRGVDPVTTYMQLVAESQQLAAETGRGTESMLGTSMSARDVANLVRWSETNIASDGALAGAHPRGAGTFPLILGRYVRRSPQLSLAQAVHKMTYRGALNSGISGRGLIREGLPADLVLFDPETVIDRATPEDPTALSEGILSVWVNGVVVYADGSATGNLPGEVILGPGAPLPSEQPQ
jgi:N-acyl-D-amino-acid deacylase